MYVSFSNDKFTMFVAYMIFCLGIGIRKGIRLSENIKDVTGGI